MCTCFWIYLWKNYQISSEMLFDSGVINLQTPTTKYLCFQSLLWKWRCVVRTRSTFSRSVMVSVAMSSLGYTDLLFIHQGTKVNDSHMFVRLLHQELLPAIRDLSGDFFTFQQDNAPVHRARENVQLLTCETPDFIAPALWPANSPDLNPVDYQTWESSFMTLTSWSHTWSKSGNITTRCSSMKRSGSGVHVFDLALEHTEDILNTDFSYVWYLYRRTLWQSYVCTIAYSGHYCFGVTSLNCYNYCKRWEILFKFGNLFAIWHCIVGPEFC